MSEFPPVSATALSAFLRGIERRAQVFALAQCGDASMATLAVQATVQTFSGQAGACPIATWPAQFWSLLVLRPELARGEGEAPLLDQLSPGPRAALLLRLVAGLDFSHGAQVLAVAEPTYRFALQRGLDQLHAAGHDMAALEALRETLKARVQAAPDGLAGVGLAGVALAATPESSRSDMAAPEVDPVVDPGVESRARTAPSRAWLPLLVLALLCALGLSFLPPVEAWWRGLFSARTPVGATSTPTPNTDSDLLTHPDFELLRTPADEALAQDLGFLSWYEAGAPAPGEDATASDFPADPFVAPASAVFADLPDALRAPLASIADLWPLLDDRARSRLLANARQWLLLDVGQREALALRIRQWDALPAAQRARRRGAHGHWQWLLDAERLALREAARRFVALPPEQQQLLRDRYQALPVELHMAWAQGPALGRVWPALSPLFEFVPADEQDGLLAVIRRLSPELRVALASRIAGMPRADRERLRRTLIATPEAAYGEVIAGSKARQ